MRKMLLATAAAVVVAMPASAAPILWAGNGHYYEYIGGNGVNWDTARAAALASNHNGQQGYLVTVTSQAEQDFIYGSVTTTTAWAGGSDAAVEGTWIWVDGPEAGAAFWQSGIGTLTYSNWNGGEPNNSGNEDALHINWSGDRWNDIGAGAGYGYIIEYGGLGNGAVPEPATWAMLILGFGAVGGVLRRGRKVRTALSYA